MNFLPSFTVWQFAAAGAIAAAGPIIIHLLNRRRFRTVQWAAMDFLREAVQRNRRILEIRDLILLALRTLAILCFGLALARPFFASGSSVLNDRQPLHAIVLIDNSLSMSYEALGGTLLERAKKRAKQYVEKLPPGSRVSVVSACGSAGAAAWEPYADHQSAVEAIDRVGIVDRTANVNRLWNDSLRAAESSPQLAKRYVFFTDQQAINWRGIDSTPPEKLPPVQFVRIAPDDYENTWISDLRLQDGLADIETPAKFTVELRHAGASPRNDLQVSLWIDGAEASVKTVSLEAGGTREVEFDHVFSNLQPEAGRPEFVSVKAVIAPDRLPQDDVRYLTVPVVASLPVVFVDQYGAEREDPAKNRLGETRHLRKLLAPALTRGDSERQLIRIRHLAAEELDREAIVEARAVVVAGLSEISPTAVKLLREYVVQGGQVLIAAGAGFDPESWNETAWLAGDGILPFPLRSVPIGRSADTGGELKPFFISYESVRNNELFQLAGETEDDLRDIYSEPFFFKAVSLETEPSVIEQFGKKLAETLLARGNEKAQLISREREFAAAEAQGKASAALREAHENDLARLAELRPAWLQWAASAEFPETGDWPEEEAERTRRVETEVNSELPRVLARFTDDKGTPFLAERRIERGRVVFCSSGLLSPWNTLPKESAIVVFDKLLREMISGTLPPRNVGAIDRLTLPLSVRDPDLNVTLLRPEAVEPEPLDIGFLSSERRGVTLEGLVRRGVYRVQAKAGGENDRRVVWEVPLAVNGAAEESETAPLERTKFETIAGPGNQQWIEESEEISLAGTAILGQNLWWYLTLLVGLILTAEMLVIWFTARRLSSATSST